MVESERHAFNFADWVPDRISRIVLPFYRDGIGACQSHVCNADDVSARVSPRPAKYAQLLDVCGFRVRFLAQLTKYCAYQLKILFMQLDRHYVE